MISLLKEYIPDSLPHDVMLETNPNLRMKVDESGKFLPFYGNTVVFDLSEETKSQLEQLREELYSAAGWMLSERLDRSTFHMTLHDLVNGPEWNETLRAQMEAAQTGARGLISQWKDRKNIRMKGTWLFNMVNTSIVLGLEPADDESKDALVELYCALERVVPLNRPLTPHITMAYFRPGKYFPYETDRLRMGLKPAALDVELRMKDLVFQNFAHMNFYTEEDLLKE